MPLLRKKSAISSWVEPIPISLPIISCSGLTVSSRMFILALVKIQIMIQTFLISGMTCLSCKANVEHTLNNFDDVNEASVDFDKKELTVNSNKDIDLTIFNKLLSPKYAISIDNQKDKLKSTELLEDQEKSKLHQLKPLLLILLYITTASILLHFKNWSWNEFMLDYMGLFFIFFSFFKMLDLKGFSQSFKMYDPLAKRIPLYASLL